VSTATIIPATPSQGINPVNVLNASTFILPSLAMVFENPRNI
jgi:hypothetical protein